MSATVKASVVERIAASPLTTFGAPPPVDTATPYVLVYFDGGPRNSEREADALERRDYGFQTVVVGKSITECDNARERLSAAVEGWRPVVDGRLCARVDNVGSQITKPDPDLPDRTLYIATDQWRAVSDPA